jgi:hypothetical protein
VLADGYDRRKAVTITGYEQKEKKKKKKKKTVKSVACKCMNAPISEKYFSLFP